MPSVDRQISQGESASSARSRPLPRSAALAIYERELAYYRADEPFLPLEKAAERCVKLSILLTQAQIATLESGRSERR